ncbi:MAG: radical SAM protein [Chloroflexota bacterium]
MKKPYFVDWAITNRCNLNCPHCTGMMAEELTTAEAERLIDDIGQLGPGWVLVEGGEPLLRPDLFKLLGRIRGHGLELYLISNGMILNEQAVSSLRELGVKLLLSVDGTDKQTYEEIKFGASWEQLLESARLAREAGILHGMTVVLSRRNKNQVEGFLSLASTMGMKAIIFIGLQPAAGSITLTQASLLQHKALAPEEYEECIYRVRRAMEGSSLSIFFDEPFWGPVVSELGCSGGGSDLNTGIVVTEERGCIMGEWIYIQTNGDVRPCMFAPDELTYGNVRQTSLSRIWEKMQQDELLRGLKQRSRRHGSCARCPHFEGCGGCPVRIFGAEGDWFGSDPACPLGARALA